MLFASSRESGTGGPELGSNPRSNIMFSSAQGQGNYERLEQEEEELEREEEFCVGSTKVLASTTTTTSLPWSIDWRDLLAVPTSSR